MTLSNKYFATQNVYIILKIHAGNTCILLYMFCLFLAKWNIGLGLNVTSSTWKQLKCDICTIVLCFSKILSLLIIAFSYHQKECTIILLDTYLFLLFYLIHVLSDYVVMELCFTYSTIEEVCAICIQIVKCRLLLEKALINSIRVHYNIQNLTRTYIKCYIMYNVCNLYNVYLK